MEQVYEIIEQVGSFACFAIVVCVVAMLIISWMDRYPPRRQVKTQSKIVPRKSSSSDANDGEVSSGD